MDNLIGRNNPDYVAKDEYYTPFYIFEKLDFVFDLDVAAPVEDLSHVTASASYNVNIDGLKADWYGTIWMNPPFSKAKPWVEKFISHNNGIALLPTSKARWFEQIWESADGIALLGNQLKFEYEGKVNKGIFMPCLLFAMGETCADVLRNAGFSRVR